MGTRADFYVGIDSKTEWIGSIGWDGYPEGIPKGIKEATTEIEFRNQVNKCLEESNGNFPVNGWPWPWTDGRTTDYSYFYFEGCVFVSKFGSNAVPVQYISESGDFTKAPPRDSIKVFFPDMKHIQKVNFGKGSGLMIFTTKQENNNEI